MKKKNHDNYALLRFEDLDKVIDYYHLFKDEFSKRELTRNENKKILYCKTMAAIQNK